MPQAEVTGPTALTVVRDVPPVRLRPLPALPTADGIRGMRELANEICKTDFVPPGFRGRADAVLAAFAYGRELGFQPMTALKYLDNIQGQITVKPRAMSALIRSAGHTLSYPEATATKCTVYGKRYDTGEEMTVSWTIEQAKRAGLVRDGSGWTKYPEDMLVARATGTIGRRLFEDVVLGLYAPEEMGGEPDEAEIIDGRAEAVAQPSLTQVMKTPDASKGGDPSSSATTPPTTTASPTTSAGAGDTQTSAVETQQAKSQPASPAPPASGSATTAPAPPNTSAGAATASPSPVAATPSPASVEPPELAFGESQSETAQELRRQALEKAMQATRMSAERRTPNTQYSDAMIEAKAKLAIANWFKTKRGGVELEQAGSEDLMALIEAIDVTLQG